MEGRGRRGTPDRDQAPRGLREPHRILNPLHSNPSKRFVKKLRSIVVSSGLLLWLASPVQAGEPGEAATSSEPDLPRPGGGRGPEALRRRPRPGCALQPADTTRGVRYPAGGRGSRVARGRVVLREAGPDALDLRGARAESGGHQRRRDALDLRPDLRRGPEDPGDRWLPDRGRDPSSCSAPAKMRSGLRGDRGVLRRTDDHHAEPGAACRASRPPTSGSS